MNVKFSKSRQFLRFKKLAVLLVLVSEKKRNKRTAETRIYADFRIRVMKVKIGSIRVDLIVSNEFGKC